MSTRDTASSDAPEKTTLVHLASLLANQQIPGNVLKQLTKSLHLKDLTAVILRIPTTIVSEDEADALFESELHLNMDEIISSYDEIKASYIHYIVNIIYYV